MDLIPIWISNKDKICKGLDDYSNISYLYVYTEYLHYISPIPDYILSSLKGRTLYIIHIPYIVYHSFLHVLTLN